MEVKQLYFVEIHSTKLKFKETSFYWLSPTLS